MYIKYKYIIRLHTIAYPQIHIAFRGTLLLLGCKCFKYYRCYREPGITKLGYLIKLGIVKARYSAIGYSKLESQVPVPETWNLSTWNPKLEYLPEIRLPKTLCGFLFLTLTFIGSRELVICENLWEGRFH